MKHALFALLLLIRLHPAFAAVRPNIVIILADDYGYGSAGCYGADSKLVRTPNIDRLAAEGRRFTDANTTSSVCSPTRYSLLTGRYCWRTSAKSGVLSTFAPLHIETTRLNMASLLKKHGYQSAAIGKWHLGYGTADSTPKWRADFTAELSPGPLDIGFDYHFGVPSNHGDVTGVFVENRFVYGLRSGHIPASMKLPGPQPDDDHFKPTYTGADTESGRATIIDVDAPRRVNERVMPMLTDKATQWIAQQKAGTPFCLYFTPVAVHNPVTPDKDLAGKSAAGLYGDWIHELDRSVGRVLDTLDKTGHAKDTLVIFTADNGGVFKPEREGLQTDAFKAGLKINGALKGGKHDVWEGGFKVPFIVRWPGKVTPGSECSAMISLVDVLATTSAIVGDALPPAAQAAEDSRSFLPSILAPGKAEPARKDMIVHSSDGVFALRQGPWKWIEGIPADDVKPAARKAKNPQFQPQLYNTKDDPAETTNIAAQHPEIVADLSALLARYRDGGYSRELPPIVEKPKPVVLAPLTGSLLIDEPLKAIPAKPWTASAGDWSAHDDALWAAQKPGSEKTPPASLRSPLELTDGSIEYAICFHGGDRHSLRIHTADGQQSFRVVISPKGIEIAKMPDAGEAKDKIISLATAKLKLQQQQWYPFRLTFKGDSVTAQIAEATATAKHPVIAKAKAQMFLLAFGKEIGFRGLKVAK